MISYQSIFFWLHKSLSPNKIIPKYFYNQIDDYSDYFIIQILWNDYSGEKIFDNHTGHTGISFAAYAIIT